MLHASHPRSHRLSSTSALKSLVLVGVAGIALLVVGLVLGIIAYDKKYFPDDQDLARGERSDPSAFWEIVSTIGFVFSVVGALLVPISIIGILIFAGRSADPGRDTLSDVRQSISGRSRAGRTQRRCRARA